MKGIDLADQKPGLKKFLSLSLMLGMTLLPGGINAEDINTNSDSFFISDQSETLFSCDPILFCAPDPDQECQGRMGNKLEGNGKTNKDGHTQKVAQLHQEKDTAKRKLKYSAEDQLTDADMVNGKPTDQYLKNLNRAAKAYFREMANNLAGVECAKQKLCPGSAPCKFRISLIRSESASVPYEMQKGTVVIVDTYIYDYSCGCVG